MALKGIMAISGFPGLFKMISQAKNSIIVESLTDGKRMPAFNSYKISSLEDIAVFTAEKEVPIKEVLLKMLKKFDSKPATDTKGNDKELVGLFSEILPEYDKERVYLSDIRKIFSWYNLLVQKEILKSESPAGAENNTEKTETPEENISQIAKTEAVQKKPKAKPSTKQQTRSMSAKKSVTHRKTGE